MERVKKHLNRMPKAVVKSPSLEVFRNHVMWHLRTRFISSGAVLILAFDDFMILSFYDSPVL